MSRTRIGIAVVGAGLIGQRHAALVAASADAALVAIVDPSTAAAVVAGRHGAPLFGSIGDMLAKLRPDGMIVATPNQMHVEHGLAAIAAGIPVLVEKPIADDLAGGLRFVEAAEKAGVPLAVGHHRRHNPKIAAAKAIVESGRLGRIVAVHASFWLAKPDGYFEAAWRRMPGGGPVLLNLIHDVDLLRHLCGDVEQVQALSSNAVRGNPVEESCVALLKFKSGALGTVTVSDAVAAPWSWELTAGENPAYPDTGEAAYQIGGTLGSLAVPTLDVWSYGGKPDWMTPIEMRRETAPALDPLALQIAQFCRVIRGTERPLVSGREGLRTLELVAAIQTAARDGATVRIG
ncbi:MAG: Gfo/Idh/MocA family oxidoreductase [Proteobacteria bacterium]|nr:Gfo/Idh/MocA family oxidoreductase [Pseudomonadota bacterium]